MKQPIWVRERTPPSPPPTSFQPMRKRERGKGSRRIHERDPAMIEMIMMRYRLLLLILSVTVFKP
ncbi:MAG: hypothetical protein MPW15_06425 [Candidatus Manganitrophus sp.]|nr:hypothetical protein [Candidatus Manganitrophus sp.]